MIEPLPKRPAPSRRVVALVLLGALLTAACGARLSDQQRAAAIAGSAGGSLAGGAEGDDGAFDGFGTEGSADLFGSDSDTGTGGASGTAGRTASGGAGGPSTGSASADVPVGQLKATDTGVTPSEIVVATLADISGVQPGLFQAAHDGAKAAAAFINSQRGINGRKIRLMLLDTKTDSGGNRAAMLDACAKAFAVVGSMSAFDDGSAKPGESCGIPDLTAITTNGPKFRAANTFPIFPNGPATIATTPPTVIKQRFPNSIKKAGVLWLNQTVTRANALRRVEGWESIGFEFIYRQEVQVLEADYTRFVIDMRNQGVDYVTMVSDFQNIVRLQKAMRQQNFVPTVRDWDSVAFDPGYLEQGKEAVEGSLVFINTAPFSDLAQNREMQLYFEWLRRAAPGRSPSYFGLYAWSAFRLFQKLAGEMGPDLTRKKMLGAITATKAWTGHGLHVEHNIADKLPGTCSVYLEVKGNDFRRMHPGQGFSCEGSLHKLSQSYE